MDPKNAKYLEEHRKKRRVEQRKMRELSDEELAAMATNVDDFIPTPYVKKIKKKTGPKENYGNWLKQIGCTPGSTAISVDVIRYALLKHGKRASLVETILNRWIREKYKGPIGYYKIRVDFVMPFVDGENIIKFGTRVIMTKSYTKIFKEEYDKELEKWREEKKATKKV